MKEHLTWEILKLKEQNDAIFLVHNYQRPEIQELADILGDSLALAREAMQVKQKTIVFCGVRFMAETAKILCPDKRVLLPEINAGCPLADCATVEQVQEARKKYPDAVFMAYINTSPEVKAACDVCVTSANAFQIIQAYKSREIVYLPDKNLARYAEVKLNRSIIKWPGQCYVHDHLITLQAVENLISEHPEAVVLSHPEAAYEILQKSDVVTGTSGMLKAVAKMDKKEFIVVTEIGLVDRMRREFPDRIFYPIPGAICAQMKLTTLRSLYDALVYGKHEIHVPHAVAVRAKNALDRMLELTQ